MTEALKQFVNDNTFQAVLVMIVLDLLLGIVAAVKLGEFSFAKLAGFARDDLLGKVLPWFILYAGAVLAPSVDVLGVDLDAVQKGVFAVVVVALVGSMLSSLADLGVALPNPLSRGENTIDITDVDNS